MKMPKRRNKCDFFFLLYERKKFQFIALCNRNEKNLVV